MDTPWKWRLPSAWFDRLDELTCAWSPSDALELDRTEIVRAVREAADRREPWLIHPSLNALTSPNGEQRLQRDFQFATWVAAHSTIPASTVVVPHPMWMWTPGGGRPKRPDRYELRALGEAVAEDRGPGPIDLDPWCRSQGFPHARSWAAGPPLTAADEEELAGQAKLFFTTLAAFESIMPQCLSWVTSVTRVTIPLRGDGPAFRSESSQHVPGAVYCDLVGTVQILEALIHESAHLHLFMEEAEGPLVDPQHTQRYSSPLRPEPRPLRGILLAFHALSYICAFYADLSSSGLILSARLEHERSTLSAKLKEAMHVLEGGTDGLTQAGRDFVEKTKEVARYAEERR